MAAIRLRGMTWDHRRAIDPLIGTAPLFKSLHPHVEVEWSSRPLSGFEFTSVDGLAAAYDLIILDHPFMGEVAVSQSLVPLDGVVALDENRFVGPSLASYRMDGKLWALPVDAACQVSVMRPDLMEGLDAAPPVDWRELLALGVKAKRKGLRLAIGLKGVHSLMTFFTLMANLGSPCAINRGAAFADPRAAREALDLLRGLLQLCPPQSLDWNSIALHDQMVARDDLVFCPAVYCYATYAEADQRRPLRFHNFPGLNGPAGSTIGGTGLGISARTRHRAEALDYVRFAAGRAGRDAQRAFAMHHGQPARREAWEDAAINQRFGGCYRETLATMDAAWIRPRYQGYLAFQAAGGELVEAYLRGHITNDRLLAELQRLHAPG
jgi:multiple sugar transport system substrate-binding protein